MPPFVWSAAMRTDIDKIGFCKLPKNFHFAAAAAAAAASVTVTMFEPSVGSIFHPNVISLHTQVHPNPTIQTGQMKEN